MVGVEDAKETLEDPVEDSVAVTQEESSQPSSEEDSGDELEDGPPLLKYTRFDKKLPPNFFQRDSISAMLLTDNFFAFGTEAGILHLTDKYFNTLKTFKCHRSSIRKISTDFVQNKYFGTASLDGTVVIGEYANPSNTTVAYDFKRPVNSLVLDKDYERNKNFISGGTAGDVVLSQRNWLGNRLDVVLNSEEHRLHQHSKNLSADKILELNYINDVLIWFNNNGITFYDIYSKTTLLNIPFPMEGEGEQTRSDLYKPYLHVSDTDRIIIGWYKYIWILKISVLKLSYNNSKDKSSPNGTSRSSVASSSTGFVPSKIFNEPKNISTFLSNAASSLKATPDKKIELEVNFNIDFLISGISSFKDDQLLVLGFENYSTQDYRKRIITPPEIKILSMVDGREEMSNEIIVKDYKSLSINDFYLAKYIDDLTTCYYLICPTDAICIQELTLKDHYDWYVKNKMYLKAWEIGEYVTDDYERFKVGLLYLQDILDSDNNEHLAKMINSILNYRKLDNIQDGELLQNIKDEWKKHILHFAKNGELSLIINYIPTYYNIGVDTYDIVLDSLLKEKDFTGLLALLENWPPDLYNRKLLTDNVEQLIQLQDTDNVEYRKLVIYLYSKEEKYSKAIPHMLIINDLNALDILISHDIVSQFMNDIVRIVLLPFNNDIKKFDELALGEVELLLTKPIQILVKSKDTLDLKKLIDAFSEPKSLQIVNFLFLKEISNFDPNLTIAYEDYMIQLYFNYSKSEVLYVFKRKSDYNIENAIDICMKNGDAVEELIYLWGEAGETKKALSLIIDELNDPTTAIEYVNSWGDVELWEFLIGYSLDKPSFVKALLNSNDKFGETYAEVIKGMPDTMEIEGFSVIINNILKDNTLSESALKNIFKIIDDETISCSMDYMRINTMGKLFDGEADK
ncbi:hypothetical protein TPHA_0D04410 [Tetrapisispora phaffii CBS 4417]|uniref:Vps41 beta-propeller domain-containing protein n=1 Tax=Tetrapisispora phaffii (strain ATCC 24235 / CBS 4417 / NBRC 1672 / NRRL Y-8282 / UCD 70-5) TaxID=1071381 RepID=G8BS00_TETPH|nr:hypothetical protein TPHA_0D04410 [Tetrapisispora phaffii CBS 4417]CCE63075.1 hypothetical protein TPHA_0D04410 [Tetrapisispora phaffii CBS 4417]